MAYEFSALRLQRVILGFTKGIVIPTILSNNSMHIKRCRRVCVTSHWRWMRRGWKWRAWDKISSMSTRRKVRSSSNTSTLWSLHFIINGSNMRIEKHRSKRKMTNLGMSWPMVSGKHLMFVSMGDQMWHAILASNALYVLHWRCNTGQCHELTYVGASTHLILSRRTCRCVHRSCFTSTWF